jgi:hypothetical protein
VIAELTAAHAEALARHLPRAVAVVRDASPAAAVALVAAGLGLLAIGARWRRPVALVGGAAAGALAGGLLSGPAAELAGVSRTTTVVAGVGIVALGSLAAPQLFPIALGAAIGGAVGVRLPLGFPIVSAVAGALAIAAAAVLGARLLAALVAAIVGASLAVAGLVALAPRLPTDALARHPLVAIGLVAVLAIAGAAAQADAAWGGAGGGGRPRTRTAAPDETAE